MSCKHRYIGNYDNYGGAPEFCSYPDLYHRLGLTLPADAGGVCLFHSLDVAWKRDNGFAARFLELIAILQGDDDAGSYDFAEFVLVGEPSPKRPAKSVLRISDIALKRPARFIAATFIDPVIFEQVHFEDSAIFGQARFRHDLTFAVTVFRRTEFAGARFEQRAYFSDVEFQNLAFFDAARFVGTNTGSTVKFERSTFGGITEFSNVVFNLGPQSAVSFWEVTFQDAVSFRETQFHCQVDFDDVVFADNADFIDTAFSSPGSSATFRGAAVEFKQLTVSENALIQFVSTDPANKLFHHSVQMTFKGEPAGKIRFENVDFAKFASPAKLRLLELSRSGTVEIGPGCIKYLFQTPLRTLSIRDGNQSLVEELCQTFSNYFVQSNGLNLGFEVTQRAADHITFFYFSDENLTETVFMERLAQTERRLLAFLSVRNEEDLITVGRSPAVARPQFYVINAIDAISGMMGVFMRIGARLMMDAWSVEETHTLLESIRFNADGDRRLADSLHQMIADKYSSQGTLGLNQQQHLRLLLPANAPTREKVRILFLAASPYDEQELDLTQNVSRIKEELRIAPEHDSFEFDSDLTVTIDSMTRAMHSFRPAFLHFAAHGFPGGIVIEEGVHQSRPIATAALSEFLGHFAGSLRCVILCACDTEELAKAIHAKIPYVVGMRGRIGDDAAIWFSVGFYQALAAGSGIADAFQFGVDRLRFQAAEYAETPVIFGVEMGA